MTNTLLISLAAVLALVPAAVLPFRRMEARRDGLFWALLAVAFLGPASYAATQFAGQWHSGLSATLWVSITASVALFAVVSAVTREGWRLAPLMLGYLAVVAVLAALGAQAPETLRRPAAMDIWLVGHIMLSVAAYALATVAAVAGAAVLLQERALKRKRPGRLTAVLPSAADGERLQVRLLATAGAVLAVNIGSGMAVEFVRSGLPMRFEHKTLLSLLAFGVILALMVIHHRSGVRGRFAARLVLVSYLLLTLGYPGVKFVTDILMA